MDEEATDYSYTLTVKSRHGTVWDFSGKRSGSNFKKSMKDSLLGLGDKGFIFVALPGVVGVALPRIPFTFPKWEGNHDTNNNAANFYNNGWTVGGGGYVGWLSNNITSSTMLNIINKSYSDKHYQQRGLEHLIYTLFLTIKMLSYLKFEQFLEYVTYRPDPNYNNEYAKEQLDVCITRTNGKVKSKQCSSSWGGGVLDKTSINIDIYNVFF